ncbi:MAG: addiction module protein, partial [Dehalococcoidia bacterium]
RREFPATQVDGLTRPTAKGRGLGLPLQGLGGRLVVMTNALREELFKLSAAERLELVEELWDSIADEDEALELTNEQREDLERRLAEADADPTGGAPWEEVRERIRHRPR